MKLTILPEYVLLELLLFKYIINIGWGIKENQVVVVTIHKCDTIVLNFQIAKTS